jgi:hypothetical protein
MRSYKSTFLLILLIGLVTALISSPALAQTPATPEYRLNLSRDFGYGGGADIRGLFSVGVAGPEGIQSVTYRIDGELMATVSADPFKFQFNTSQYSFGWHDLAAEVTTSSGAVFVTPTRRMNFVTSAEESAAMKNIMLPMLGLVVGIFLIMILAQFVVFRKRNPNGVTPGTQRKYGIAGGSVCKKCGRPTPRHLFGFNVGLGKLDRCENCGRWSVMRAMPLDVLRAAEIAEKQSESSQSTVSEKSDEEKLKELVEKSKYE